MKGTRPKIFIIGLTLLVFSLSTSGQSGSLYHCVNSQGSVLLTDSPTDPDYKCTVAASFKDLTPQERAKKQREVEADRQRMRAAVEKQEANRRANQARQAQEESQRNLQRSRNQRAEKLESDARERLRAVRDAGFKLPQSHIDMLEKAAAIKAAQIREGTDKPMSEREDTEFHMRQEIESEIRTHELFNH